VKTRLEQVLERHLNGREIAVWGAPTRPMLRALKSYKFHIAGIADKVDPEKHYVVAVNDDDLDDFLTDAQSGRFNCVNDYLTFNEFG
jgi:aminocyclitol acetyltransferase